MIKRENITLLNLTWYQRMHDKNYHRDIYHMPTMQRIQHLVNHISKYHRREFNVASLNRNELLFKDTLACIFSIADALNVDLGKYIGDSGKVVSLTEPHFDIFASNRHMDVALGAMTKAIEGFDHIENINYREVLVTNLITLFNCTLQMFSKGVHGFRSVGSAFQEDVQELLEQWFNNLESIKERHCFNEYFHELDAKSTTFMEVRQAFLTSE